MNKFFVLKRRLALLNAKCTQDRQLLLQSKAETKKTLHKKMTSGSTLTTVFLFGFSSGYLSDNQKAYKKADENQSTSIIDRIKAPLFMLFIKRYLSNF